MSPLEQRLPENKYLNYEDGLHFIFSEMRKKQNSCSVFESLKNTLGVNLPRSLGAPINFLNILPELVSKLWAIHKPHCEQEHKR